MKLSEMLTEYLDLRENDPDNNPHNDWLSIDQMYERRTTRQTRMNELLDMMDSVHIHVVKPIRIIT